VLGQSPQDNADEYAVAGNGKEGASVRERARCASLCGGPSGLGGAFVLADGAPFSRSHEDPLASGFTRPGLLWRTSFMAQLNLSTQFYQIAREEVNDK